MGVDEKKAGPDGKGEGDDAKEGLRDEKGETIDEKGLNEMKNAFISMGYLPIRFNVC